MGPFVVWQQVRRAYRETLMTIRIYSTPEAFRQALEQRLRSGTESGTEFSRKRQLLVFDRFLARIAAVLGDAAILKARRTSPRNFMRIRCRGPARTRG